MFKIGDRVKYIKHDTYWLKLEIGKIYTIDHIFKDKTLAVLESEYPHSIYSFISIKDERKKKLKELLNYE